MVFTGFQVVLGELAVLVGAQGGELGTRGDPVGLLANSRRSSVVKLCTFLSAVDCLVGYIVL